MSKEAELSFIICTYNRAGYLDDSISSLLEGSSPKKMIELLVIDNNSADETPERVQQHQKVNHAKNIQIRYVKEINQGLSHARNRGVEEANAPVVVFVDDDIRASKNFINSWIHFFEGQHDVKAAGGKILVQFDDPRPKWMSKFLLPLLGHHDFGDTVKPYGKTDYPFGGNMAFTKEVFDDYGTFNTGLGRIGTDLKASEEKEFFRRLQQNGKNIYYVPEAFLYHRVNSSRLTKDYIRRQAIGLGHSIKFQMKHASGILKASTLAKEIGKWAATFALLIFYSLKFQLSKGVTLIQFRYWILQGLRST